MIFPQELEEKLNTSIAEMGRDGLFDDEPTSGRTDENGGIYNCEDCEESDGQEV